MSDQVKIIILQDLTAFIGALGALLVYMLAYLPAGWLTYLPAKRYDT